jgi:hypothetical protein
MAKSNARCMIAGIQCSIDVGGNIMLVKWLVDWLVKW